MLGEQIIRGMAVTARNFLGSYVSKDRLTTVQYPEERLPQIGHTRQFPMLVFDGDQVAACGAVGIIVVLVFWACSYIERDEAHSGSSVCTEELPKARAFVCQEADVQMLHASRHVHPFIPQSEAEIAQAVHES